MGEAKKCVDKPDTFVGKTTERKMVDIGMLSLFLNWSNARVTELFVWPPSGGDSSASFPLIYDGKCV